MNNKEKREKKREISKYIDLANGHFKDNEIELLHNLVKNKDDYNGKSKEYKHTFDGWCSDGKYTRDEQTTYTFHSDQSSIYIEKDYRYWDDDGQSGGDSSVLKTAREIINGFKKIF